MRLIFSDDAWKITLFWQKQYRRMVDRINKLIKETTREPFWSGQARAELKHALAGYWSRRITDEPEWFTKWRMMPFGSFNSSTTTEKTPNV